MYKNILIFIFLAIAIISCRKSEYLIPENEVISDLGGGTGTVTWTNDKSYLLDGFVFVNDGQVLTIEAGTVIRAKTGQGRRASALIVARGGKIIAEGSSDKPIIFTVEGDDLEGSVPLKTRGLWGGLIILGNAPVNSPSGESFIEGIPISEPRGVYGGAFEDDNSGILTYISLRHGGTKIGEGNEINGLTLGGVGRKTLISHIEIISNSDDGLELFGGTVNLSNVAVAFCGDDAFDFDEGYRGKCQFLLGLQDDEAGDHLAEHTGNPYPYTPDFFSLPEIYNATFIGNTPGNDSVLISLQKGSGAVYRNSIFMNNEAGISIDHSGGFDTYSKISNGMLDISHNIFWNIANNNPDSLFILVPEEKVTEPIHQEMRDYFMNERFNTIGDPGITIVEFPYNLLPETTVFSNMAAYDSPWYEDVSYKGAFGSRNWLQGWSLLWKEGLVR